MFKHILLTVLLLSISVGKPAAADDTALKELTTLEWKRGIAGPIAFSHDGRTVAICACDINFSAELDRNDAEVLFFDSTTWKKKGEIDLKDWVPTQMEFLSDDQGIIVAAFSDHVRLCSIDEKVCNIVGDKLGRSFVTALSGSLIIGSRSDHFVQIWDNKSGKQLEEWRLNGPRGEPCPLAVSADSKTLAIAVAARRKDAQDEITLIKAEDASEIARLGGSGGRLASIAFSADGQTVWGGRIDGRLLSWDLSASKSSAVSIEDPEGMNREIRKIGLSPDGRQLAVVRSPHHFQLWSTESKAVIASFNGPGIFDFAFSPDSRRLITTNSASKASVIVWECRGSSR